ncbi:MAG: tRNA (adenine-N1)-methyltransferase [Candidatus Altiarchaeota archaeon]|nr:tRNA (adenine-N1)-methyltransferase [Candidatus Altiarchaeota archaeon]
MKRLLIDRKGKRQLVEEGKDLHTHGGVIKLEGLRKVRYSGQVETHTGKRFFILEPSIIDFIEKMEKRAQIVYPKDSAVIIGLTGLSSGSRVVEAGTGVAGLTLMLANAVKPEGKIYSYEIRPEHLKEARAHLEEAGLSKFVGLKNQDIYEGIDEKDLDAVILDLSEPWRVTLHAARALKFGGYLISYSPSIEQVKKFVTSLPQHFQDTNTIEIILRDWEISEQRCRPKTRMIGHTGFITITRKLQE